jgi:hypothetical protein
MPASVSIVFKKPDKRMTSIKNTIEENQNNRENLEEDEELKKYEVQGERLLKREYDMVHTPNARNCLPKTLPTDNWEEEVIKATKYDYCLSIRINDKYNTRLQIKRARLLLAVFKALQIAQPATYLAPLRINPDKTPKIIHSTDDVPIVPNYLKQYMEILPNNKPGKMVAKIRIWTDSPLWTLKMNEDVMTYFESECINIEQNDLNCIIPAKIGFFENITVRGETIDLYTARLQDLLPPNMPKFQLLIQRLWLNMNEKCKVLMLLCAPEDANLFINEMKLLITNNMVDFFMWKQFKSLLDDQKQTVIDSQYNYNANYRSLTLTGFIDHDKEIPMRIYDGENDETHFLENITISDYIKNHIISGDGTPLFTGVHSTINGTKEFTVELHHFDEARDWVELGIGELCRPMNNYSIGLIFEDPAAAVFETYKDQWEPYFRNKNVPMTPSRYGRNKRARAITPAKSRPNPTPTYASVTVNKINTVTPNQTNKTPTRVIPPPSILRNNDDTVNMVMEDSKNEINTTIGIELSANNRTEVNNGNNGYNKQQPMSMELITQHIAIETDKIRTQISADLKRQMEEQNNKTTATIMNKFDHMEARMNIVTENHNKDFQQMSTDIANLLELFKLSNLNNSNNNNNIKNMMLQNLSTQPDHLMNEANGKENCNINQYNQSK